MSAAPERGKFLQRDRLLSFTSFHRHRAAVFTDKKMLQRRQQIRTQTSFLFANIIKIPALQQQGKKGSGLDLPLPLCPVPSRLIKL